jgi:soluble lytic murein transglycosylase-like protein
VAYQAGASARGRTELWFPQRVRSLVLVLMLAGAVISARRGNVGTEWSHLMNMPFGGVPAQQLPLSVAAAVARDAEGVRYREVAIALKGFGIANARVGPVALAIEREAVRTGIDPLLIAAVISAENPELKPRAKSPAGALGIMQVMPLWLPSFRKICGDDLRRIDTNVCFGVRVLKTHITEANGSVEQGLLAYVGCVRDVACRDYPRRVIKRWRGARRAS